MQNERRAALILGLIAVAFAGVLALSAIHTSYVFIVARTGADCGTALVPKHFDNVPTQRFNVGNADAEKACSRAVGKRRQQAASVFVLGVGAALWGIWKDETSETRSIASHR